MLLCLHQVLDLQHELSKYRNLFCKFYQYLFFFFFPFQDGSITIAANEAKDNVRYLYTLDKFFALLAKTSPVSGTLNKNNTKFRQEKAFADERRMFFCSVFNSCS